MTTLWATVFVLSILVLVHELGHFFMAKLFKIRVERFSIGFPPRLFGKTFGGTDYCISAVPFGGYVKISGMIDESLDTSQVSGPPKPWEFRSKKWSQKCLVILAGSLMNFLLAYTIFVASTKIHGIEKPKGTWIGGVIPGKPAEKAGLQVGDRILRINGKSIKNWEDLTNIVHASPNQPLQVEWARGDSVFSAVMIPEKEKFVYKGDIREGGILGIYSQIEIHPASWWSAFGEAGKNFYYLPKLVLVSFVKLVTGQESLKSIAGPVFIAKMAGESARFGFGPLFEFMAILSLNLGILNLFPIPVLDGGHLVILIIEGIVRRELSVKVKMIIQQVGIALIIGLMLIALYNDVLRLVRP